MVDIADIRDEDSLKAWLEDQPHAVSVWIASRAAARVLPLWSLGNLDVRGVEKGDVTALLMLRCLLVSSVAAFLPSDEIRSVAPAAAKAAAPNAAGPDPGSAYAARSAAAADAEQAAANASRAIGVALSATASSSNNATDDSWVAIRADARRAARGEIPDALPLWPEGTGPFTEEWHGAHTLARNPDPEGNWQFWIDWYDAQLSGRTMLPDPKRTWDMLEQIALIDPATWDAGPETVNPIIREIWKLHHLRSEVAVMQAEKEAFLAARASMAQRSHNHPPEGLVDDQPELARQITIVWDSLDEARYELEQDAPDKGLLRKIAEKLLSALSAIAKYCGKVADTAIMSAAEGAGKEAGKLGVRAAGITVLDHVLNNGRLTQFAKDLFTFGAGW